MDRFDLRGWPKAKTIESISAYDVNLVTDGSFTGDGSAWTQGDGWSLDDPNDEMDCDGSQVANSDLSQNMSAVAGRTYRVIFTIKNYSAGTLTPKLGTSAGTAVSSNGTFTQKIAAQASILYFTADADFVGTIDDISVQWEITDYKGLFQYIHGTTKEWVYSLNDLDFATNPIASDSFERMYFTGEFEPRAFANDIVSTPFDASTDYYKFGAANPTIKPTIDAGYTAGSDYRAYFYTYVTRYGEETGPSPVDEITDYGSGNVTLSSFTQPPAGFALRTKVGSNAPKIRVYRTNASATGAEFQYVGEFDIDTFNFSTGTFTDSVADANLGEVCPTQNYVGIDSSLKGLVSLPNGILAGFKNNEVHFSEPYYPHAYPISYRMTLDYDVVALGTLGTSIIVATEGYTYLVYGDHPSTMIKQRLAGYYPCISKRGLVSTHLGVFYPSYEGLILATEQGLRNASFDFITPDEWQSYYPSTLNAEFFNGKYFGWYFSSPVKGGFVLDIENGILTTLLDYSDVGYISISEGKLYIINKNSIKEWAGDPYNYTSYTWKSKRFLLPQAMSFTCGQVHVDTDSYSTILSLISENEYLKGLNQSIFAGDLEDQFNSYQFNAEVWNGSKLYDLTSLAISPYINFKLFVQGKEVYETSLTNGYWFRLPPIRGRQVEVQLSGFMPVQRVTIAQSPRELRDVT